VDTSLQLSLFIESDSGQVWDLLTRPALMTKWMGDPEMQITITTDWKVNSPISIEGFHHLPFTNNGMVLEFVEQRKLTYSHLSSLSKLPDLKENYTIFSFTVSAENNGTLLQIGISNFPTDTIYHHLKFYWTTTIHKIKQMAEKG
jgi:uncharacterized protein YndB with AHSA1/START domain